MLRKIILKERSGRGQLAFPVTPPDFIVSDMPFKTGFTIKSTIAQTDLNKPAIVTDQPYAKYLYHGKVMVGIAPKQLTDTPLNYSHHKNPLAGFYWDRLLIAAEKPAIVADLQRYIKRRSSR